MLSILLGPDDFTKKEYVKDLAAKHKADLVFFYAGDQVPEHLNLTEQDLFGKQKLHVFWGGLDQLLASRPGLDGVITGKNYTVVAQEKLDKRSTAAKSLVANEKVEIKNFPLPHGREFNSWLVQRAKKLGLNLPPRVADLLAQRLGRDEGQEVKFGGKVVEVKEIFSLWQASSELLKLQALADEGEVTETMVKELVPENAEVDVLSIVNAMGEGKKQETINLIQEFLNVGAGSDEKSLIIQLNALLSEQFRNVLMVKDFEKNRTSEAEVLEKTGWKSGRLFVIKKIAVRFQENRVLDFLNKLSSLDEELKTSSTPPKVLLDLIVTQLF